MDYTGAQVVQTLRVFLKKKVLRLLKLSPSLFGSFHSNEGDFL